MQRHPRVSTLFPYTTLFRSSRGGSLRLVGIRRRPIRRPKRKCSIVSSILDPLHAAQLGAMFSHPDRKSTRLNSSHANISYAVFCLKKKKNKHQLQGWARRGG